MMASHGSWPGGLSIWRPQWPAHSGAIVFLRASSSVIVDIEDLIHGDRHLSRRHGVDRIFVYRLLFLRREAIGAHPVVASEIFPVLEFGAVLCGPDLTKAREISEAAEREHRDLTDEEKAIVEPTIKTAREIADNMAKTRDEDATMKAINDEFADVIGGLNHGELSLSASPGKSARLSFKGMGGHVAKQMLPDGMKALAPSGAAVVGQEMKPDPVALGQPALRLGHALDRDLYTIVDQDGYKLVWNHKPNELRCASASTLVNPHKSDYITGSERSRLNSEWENRAFVGDFCDMPALEASWREKARDQHADSVRAIKLRSEGRSPALDRAGRPEMTTDSEKDRQIGLSHALAEFEQLLVNDTVPTGPPRPTRVAIAHLWDPVPGGDTYHSLTVTEDCGGAYYAIRVVTPFTEADYALTPDDLRGLAQTILDHLDTCRPVQNSEL